MQEWLWWALTDQRRDRGHGWLVQCFCGCLIPRDHLPALGGIFGRRELHPSAVLSQPLGIPSLERLGTLDERRVRVGLESATLQRQGLERRGLRRFRQVA
jgi:hypothetical protein